MKQEMADRIAVIVDGRLMVGETAKIFSQPVPEIRNHPF